ncbi:MAG: glycosyltransferase family 4 protein [Nanoarchaeota archaeon]
MKVLMFGWEFPPQSSGGLGTACYGLTKGLSKKNTDITLVVPTMGHHEHDFLKIISAGDLKNVTLRSVKSALTPYVTSESYAHRILRRFRNNKASHLYGKNLYEEVYRFSERSKFIAMGTDFDVIHAHDWLTFPAGIKAKKATNKPLVVHVHATEFDRTGGNVNQHVYNIEREGMHAADAVIAVSDFTKKKIVEHYGVPAEKVRVVHNAIEPKPLPPPKRNKVKTVLYLGRITLQKGPDYFLYAAKKVLTKDPNVRFVIAGHGDMEPYIIEKAAELGIASNVLFAGFLTGDAVDQAYRMADLYVMPSVSEPFGITPLEAINNGTPVLISKQSGVSEVLRNCLKVDFWDINEMANKMLGVLHYDPLHETLLENSYDEVKKFSWDDSAEKCLDVYRSVV